MKKINLFKRLLLVLIVLMTCSPQLRAQNGFWKEKAWNFEYNDGSSNIWQASELNLKSDDRTVNLGILTTFSLRGCWVKTYSDNGYYTQDMRWYYGIGEHSHDYFKDDGWACYNPRTWSFCNDDHNFITYDVIAEAPNNPGENTLWMYWYLDHEYHSGQQVQSLTCYVNFTIPGFTTTSTSKSFGTTVPVNTESETTISFGTHYGTALTTSNCAITGDNSTEFEVRSITESNVNVVFKPTSAASKSATLTITDAHGKTCTISLTGTAVAPGEKTRMYFNVYANDQEWTSESALLRFTNQYTSGVYTHYPMTKCANSAYNWYADVEIKAGNVISVDRYNPESPYQTWNGCEPTSDLSAENRYAIANGAAGDFHAYATHHTFNDVSGGNIYYDNSKSKFTNTLYLVVGRDYAMGSGLASEYSTGYSLSKITNTQLYLGTPSDDWHDATYYAVVGASSDPTGDHSWGSGDFGDKGFSGYTTAFQDILDLEDGSSYLGFASASGEALSLTKSPTLNTTQTFNYALSTDGGTVFTPMTSGSPNTPGALSISYYEFTDGTCTAVGDDPETETLSANSTTYSAEVSSVAYTGTTTLTAASRDGYTFVEWHDGTQRRTTNTSFTYYPQGDSTFTARYKAHRYTINFNKNDAQYSSAPAATGSTASMSNVVYDQEATLTANGFHRIGYKFAGWSKTDDGEVEYTDGATAIFNLTTTDGGSGTLYAQWTADNKTFKVDAESKDWADDDNWTGGAPTNDDSNVTINSEVNLSTHVHIGQLSFGENGKLNITSTGALEVEGTIDNDEASKINVAAGGALIFDNSAGSTCATVDLSLTSSRWQMIAIPVGYVNVSEAFYGSSVYTYVWKYGESWERRGYYDGVSAFESVLIKGCTGYTFSGALVSTNDQGFTASYNESKESGDVTMFGNSWTAPIAVSGITFTNIYASTPHVFNGSSWSGVLCKEIIPALQGFAVVANSGGGSVTIPYSAVRAVGSSYRNTALKAPKHRTSETSDPIAIYISGNEWKNRIRLFESEQFSDEIDDGYEAVYIEGEGLAGELYAQKSEKKMNVLATNDLEGTVVGFFPGQATNYTISFEGDGRGYYLNDAATGESTLIDEANTYNFKSDEPTNATRFVISKMPMQPTGVDEVADGSKARKQMIDGTLYIIRDGRIYDAQGALVK